MLHNDKTPIKHIKSRQTHITDAVTIIALSLMKIHRWLTVSPGYTVRMQQRKKNKQENKPQKHYHSTHKLIVNLKNLLCFNCRSKHNYCFVSSFAIIAIIKCLCNVLLVRITSGTVQQNYQRFDWNMNPLNSDTTSPIKCSGVSSFTLAINLTFKHIAWALIMK